MNDWLLINPLERVFPGDVLNSFENIDSSFPSVLLETATFAELVRAADAETREKLVSHVRVRSAISSESNRQVGRFEASLFQKFQRCPQSGSIILLFFFSLSLSISLSCPTATNTGTRVDLSCDSEDPHLPSLQSHHDKSFEKVLFAKN